MCRSLPLGIRPHVASPGMVGRPPKGGARPDFWQRSGVTGPVGIAGSCAGPIDDFKSPVLGVAPNAGSVVRTPVGPLLENNG